MLRIITVKCDSIDAVNAGGPVHTEYVTFPAECPALENWLKEYATAKYISCSILGVSVEPAEAEEQTDG